MTADQIAALREQHARDSKLTPTEMVLYEIALQLARLVEVLSIAAAQMVDATREQGWELRERLGTPHTLRGAERDGE